ncbi:MAG: type IV secretory system conjugative DNA transfer family protein [Actinobacteria bacterium]|nr:type IV secretory system conjugative DNA transfer family protein [Actinomycetota bacterium]
MERSSRWALSELVAAAVFVAVVAAGLVVWSGATVAAAVGGQGWLGADVSATAAALGALLRSPGDPAGAWADRYSSRLPGPVLYWACTGAAAAVWAALAGWVGVRCQGREWGIDRRRRFGVDTQARLARPRDLAPLVVAGPVPGRFILGRVGRHLVATEDRTAASGRMSRAARTRRGDRGAVALIGPSRCGKTTAAISGILEWDGPAVLSSVKSDLMAATLSWRSRCGQVRVFDPTGVTGQPSASWSPLRAAHTTSGAQRAARALTDASPRSDADNGEFWLSQAESLLSALLFVAAVSPGRGMADVVDWVFTQDRPADTDPGLVEPLLHAALADPDPHVAAGTVDAARVLTGVWADDERTRASVYATARSVIWPWADPGVAAAAQSCDIDLDWLCAENNTVYLCAPVEDQARLAPAFGGLLSDLLRQVALHVTRTGTPLDPPLLVVIDEAGNTPLRNLPEYASTLAGLGVLLVTIWQSKAQIDAAYGRRADVVLTNHLSKVFYAGQSDLAGLDTVSRLLGQEQVATRSLSADVGLDRRSITSSGAEAALAPVHLIRQMRPGDAVLIHATLPAAHLRTRPWFADPALRARAAGHSPPRKRLAIRTPTGERL